MKQELHQTFARQTDGQFLKQLEARQSNSTFKWKGRYSIFSISTTDFDLLAMKDWCVMLG
jgi:hypothetical protein